jgi:hypothetical protein
MWLAERIPINSLGRDRGEIAHQFRIQAGGDATGYWR